MENHPEFDQGLDMRIASRLKGLRQERGWSLDELAGRAGVSRATLSRLENAEVSPTASVLGRLCAAYGLTMSRLMLMVEDDFAPLVPESAQPVWVDASAGFRADDGRWAFFPDLLVAALQRTVALAEMDSATAAVAEHLYLDVARLLQILLQIHRCITERRLGFVAGCGDGHR